MDGEFSWRKCISTDGKGICQSSWRKWMKIPAVQLSFRAGLVETPTHGAASQRYDWPPYCCTLEFKRIRTANRRWWSFQSLRWSQVLTFVHNRISPHYSLFDMINDYPFKMSNFEMMLSLKWHMTIISKWRRKIFVQRIIFVRKHALYSRDENAPPKRGKDYSKHST